MPEPEAAGSRVIPLRMLLFIDGLGSGGAQRQFTHLAIGLARRGHRVSVAVYNEQDHFADQIKAAGIDISRLDKPSRFSPKPVFGLARLYRERSFDVVIAFLRSPAIKAELARLLVPRMTVIAAERSAYPVLPLPVGLRMSQFVHHLARFVTVNSAHQALVMKQQFPGLADRVVTIRNGVDLAPRPRAAPASPGRELSLLAVSSLMPYKNSVRLAKALALLRNEHGLRVCVSWLGETFEGKGRGYGAYGETRAHIRALALEDQWHWLGVTQDVPSVLALHDALVHPSLYEGTSNAVCEAMASSLPVIAGRIADHAEMLEQTGAGITFDPLDVRSIADAIARFASLDASEREKMGRRGRGVIEARYSFESMVTAYERLAIAAATRAAPPHTAVTDPGERASPCAD